MATYDDVLLDDLQGRYPLTVDTDDDGEPDAPVELPTALRQETDLAAPTVGEPDLPRLDAYTLRVARSASKQVQARLIAVASGLGYSWPMTAAQLASAYPGQDAATRLNTQGIVVESAANAVAAAVKGDLFGRASSRFPDHPGYRDARNRFLGNPEDARDTGDYGRALRDALALLGAAQAPGEADTADRQRVSTVMLEADDCDAVGEYDRRRVTAGGQVYVGYDDPRFPYPGSPYDPYRGGGC
jgi:hypothetical protein